MAHPYFMDMDGDIPLDPSGRMPQWFLDAWLAQLSAMTVVTRRCLVCECPTVDHGPFKDRTTVRYWLRCWWRHQLARITEYLTARGT